MSSNTQIDVKSIDYRYADIDILNNTSNYMEAYYMKSFDQPILYNQQNYKFCVSRFRVPSTAIPIFIFQDNTYLLAFSIGPNDDKYINTY